MLAREIMTASPAFVTPNDRVSSAAALMRDRDVGAVPVVDGEDTKRLVGILTDRDVAVRCVASRHGSGCLVRDHMTSGHVHAVPADAPVRDVVEIMERDQVRRVPVVDLHGALVGIVALADLATKFAVRDPITTEEVLERVSQPRHRARQPDLAGMPGT
jgi:CBS domain-containing protein